MLPSDVQRAAHRRSRGCCSSKRPRRYAQHRVFAVPLNSPSTETSAILRPVRNEIRQLRQLVIFRWTSCEHRALLFSGNATLAAPKGRSRPNDGNFCFAARPMSGLLSVQALDCPAPELTERTMTEAIDSNASAERADGGGRGKSRNGKSLAKCPAKPKPEHHLLCP